MENVLDTLFFVLLCGLSPAYALIEISKILYITWALEGGGIPEFAPDIRQSDLAFAFKLGILFSTVPFFVWMLFRINDSSRLIFDQWHCMTGIGLGIIHLRISLYHLREFYSEKKSSLMLRHKKNFFVLGIINILTTLGIYIFF